MGLGAGVVEEVVLEVERGVVGGVDKIEIGVYKIYGLD